MVISSYSACFNEHEPSSLGSPNTPPPLPLVDSTSECRYEIKEVLDSKPSLLFFTQDRNTNEHIVIKILDKDTRSNLETIEARQRCQLEALRINRMFTPEVYIGLGRIREMNTDQIVLSEIIENPTKDILDPTADYALVMYQLPKDCRLDYLLRDEKIPVLKKRRYIQLVTRCVANMHENRSILSSCDENGIRWGSSKQLKRKLNHNLGYIDQVLLKSKYENIDINEDIDWLNDILDSLEQTLSQVFDRSPYSWYFEKRVHEHWIRYCHGDLKSQNINVVFDDQDYDAEPERCVKILDAIDFNPIYCNIDILSDFAMLVVDIQVRTQSAELADLMIEDYFLLTRQQEEIARAVLAYYLVEKALVGAIVNIVFDNMIDLGLAFLKVAEMRLDELKRQLKPVYYIPVVTNSVS